MSKYLLNKFLYTIDRDPELVERYRADPRGTVAWWEAEQANVILNCRHLTLRRMAIPSSMGHFLIIGSSAADSADAVAVKDRALLRDVLIWAADPVGSLVPRVGAQRPGPAGRPAAYRRGIRR